MRKLTVSLLLACTFATSALAAEPTSATPQDYVGHYALQDGRIMEVTADGDALVAEIQSAGAFPKSAHSKSKTIFLKPLGDGRFASTTTRMLVTFGADSRGDIAQVNVAEGADPAKAMASR